MILYLLWFKLFHAWAYGISVTPEHVELEKKQTVAVVEVFITFQNSHRNTENEIESLSIARIQNIVHARDFSHTVGDEISLRWLGGEIGNDGFLIGGAPFLKPGNHYRLGLMNHRMGEYRIALHNFVNLSNSTQAERSIGSHSRTDENSGPILAWSRKNTPIPYWISKQAPLPIRQVFQALDTSFQSWANPAGSSLSFRAMGCTDRAAQENDGLNVIFFRTDQWPYNHEAIAVTRTFYLAGDHPHSGEILDADIVINAVDFQFSIHAETGKHKLQNIVTHEVGHFIGLGHEIQPIDETATMYSVAPTAETTKETLKQTDITVLREAYPGTVEKQTAQQTICPLEESGSGCAATSHHPPHLIIPIEWIACLAFLFFKFRLSLLRSR